MPDQPPRTNLPRGIPDALKDFIRCRTTEVELEAGDLTWLPKPDAGPIPIPDATPGLTFENGPTPGSVIISVGWGFFRISVTGTIVDGKLNVEVPPIPGLGQQITDWVNDLNADLEANGMQLGDMSIRNGKLHFGKEPVPPVGETATQPAPTPQVAVTTPTATITTVPGPAAGSKTGAFLDDWKKKAGVGAGALAIGVAAFFLFVDDGQPETTASSPSTPSVVSQPASDTGSEGSTAQETSSGDADTGTATDTETPEDDTETPESDSSSSNDSGSNDSGSNDSGSNDSGSNDSGSNDSVGGVFDDLDELEGQFAFAGSRQFVQLDASGDQDFCGPNESIWADMIGLVAYRDGDMVSVGVAMDQMISPEQFSWAVLFQPESASGYRMFVAQVHDGELTMGEQLEDGTMATDSDVVITIGEYGVVFSFPFDPDDPMLYGFAQAFNLPEEGDNIGCDQAYAAVSPSPEPPSDTTGGCPASDTAICVNDRFSVDVTWRDGSSNGMGTGVTIEGDMSSFWFFSPDNVELIVQVANACSFNDHYWVFASAATDVEYTLTVADTATGESYEYFNPLGDTAQPIQDTQAFATCP